MPHGNLNQGQTHSSNLRAEVQRLLNEQKIHDIWSYAWSGPAEINPEYQGHAIWQIDPPLRRELGTSGRQEVENALMVAGSDFEGLMKISRFTIGLALAHVADAIDDPWNRNDLFWMQHMHAFLCMSIASDRIRDYLILGITRGTVPSYERKHKKNKWYTTPFTDARAFLEKAGQTDWLVSADAVPGLAEYVYEFIKKRNVVVHETATELGRMERELAACSPSGETPDSDQDMDREEEEHFGEAWEQVESQRRTELADAVLELKKWYKLLIDLSNHVFRLEYSMREKTLHTGKSNV